MRERERQSTAVLTSAIRFEASESVCSAWMVQIGGGMICTDGAGYALQCILSRLVAMLCPSPTSVAVCVGAIWLPVGAGRAVVQACLDLVIAQRQLRQAHHARTQRRHLRAGP